MSLPSRLLLCLILCMTVAGCRHVRVEPLRGSVERARLARVVVRDAAPGELKFLILNLSDRPLVVIKDSIVIEAYFGTFGHPGGGKGKRFTVAPHGSQLVSVRFSAEGLNRGDELTVHFEQALLLDGRPVKIGTLAFLVTNNS